MVVDLQLVLVYWQWFVVGYVQLLFYQVGVGNVFGDWMFYLQVGVYFYEVEIVVGIGDEFYCISVDIVYCMCGIYGCLVYCGVLFGGYVWCGCFFQYFLMVVLY